MTNATQPSPTTPKVTIKDRLAQSKQFIVDRAHRVRTALSDAWRAVFPARDEIEEEQGGGFFQALLQVILWLAFAAFLLASLPHVAYFFATFEPQNPDGTISDYWWFVSYALAVAIDVTAFLLSLNVAVKMRRATAGLPWYQKIIPAILVFITHWPFILLLVGFSWLVNFEHAKEFHSSMLADAESVTVNLLFWQGTLGDLNPVIASAFPVLAVAYTGMSDQIGDQRKVAKSQRQAMMAQSVHAAQQSATAQPEPAVITPDWQKILLTMQEMNAQTLQTMQTMQQQSLQVTVEHFTRVTVEAVREVVEQVALPAAQPPAQIEAPKDTPAQIEAIAQEVVARAIIDGQATSIAHIEARIDQAIERAMRNAPRALRTDAPAQSSTQSAQREAQTEPQLYALSEAAEKRTRALHFIDAQRAQGRMPEPKEVVEASGIALRTAQDYIKKARETAQ
jgi:hypothetical protein